MFKSKEKIISEASKFLKNDYKELYISIQDKFVGCKFNSNDKYFILFLSVINDKLFLTYRDNINEKEVKRINVNNYGVYNIIEYMEFLLERAYRNKPEKIVKSSRERETLDENDVVKNGILGFLNNISNVNKRLSKPYYLIDNYRLKDTFSEDEYDSYIDFAMEIGNKTLDILRKNVSDIDLKIFEARMNIIDIGAHTIKEIANYYNLREAEVDRSISRSKTVLKKNKKEYIILFNQIADTDILNYLIVGILNTYNEIFLKLLFKIIDAELSKKIINKVHESIKATNEHKDEVNLSMMSDINYSLINYPDKLNPNAEKIFDSLTEKGQLYLFADMEAQSLKRHDNMVAYNSKLEKEIINDYDSFNFVKGIKSQSLLIEYTYNGEKYKYYPDLQILTNTNKLVIVEVKPLRYMFDKRVLVKYGALKKFCETNGFGYLMIDDKNNTIETLKEVEVTEKIETELINSVKEKGIFKYTDYKDFHRRYGIRSKQLASIILRNYKILEFDSGSFLIKYIGD